MNWIGNQLLNIGEIEKSIDVFKLNMDAYPNSAEVYFSYATALLHTGEIDQAVEYYKKSLQLKADHPRAKQILAGLSKAKRQQGKTKITLVGHSDAKLVSLAGSFNDWDKHHTFFHKNGNNWECYVDLAPGTYTYKIVKDGEWILDPANPSTQKDDYGNTNSVLVVKK